MLKEEMKEKDIPVMTEVKSSNIEKIGHDSEGKNLYIFFKGSGLYRYGNVTLAEFELLKKSESIGKAFHSTIRIFGAKYPCVSITIIKES